MHLGSSYHGKGRTTEDYAYSSSGGSTMDSFVEFTPEEEPQRGSRRLPISSPFAFLRNRKKSNNTKSPLSNPRWRSVESFQPSNFSNDYKSLPPIPPLPQPHRYNSYPPPVTPVTDYAGINAALGSQPTSPTYGSPPPGGHSGRAYSSSYISSTVQFPTPIPYDSLPDPHGNDQRTVPVRGPQAAQAEGPETGKFNFDKALERHGSAVVDTSNVFDRNLPENMVIATALAKSNHVSDAAKLGKMIFAGSQNLDKAQALITAATNSPVWQTGKTAVMTLLEPAKDLLPILDVVTTYLPMAIAAKAIFSAIVQVELDRAENDKNVGVVYMTMADFWFTLCDLKVIFEAAEELKSSLEKYLQDACKSITDFGNFRDLYYKHGHIARTVRSGTYKKQLVGFANNFKDQKQKLSDFLQQSTALTVTKMSKDVKDISAKFDMVLNFMTKCSPFETRIMGRIEEVGGEEKAVRNTRFLTDLAENEFHEPLTPQLKTALRTDIDKQLESNLAMFQLKIEAVQQSIEKAVDRSTETILLHMESGPHNLIKDEDIKAVWKDMNWRISCKARHFVDAIHQHYAHKFAKHRHTTGQPHPEQWTLKFLSKVIFQPTIGDAIDEDASGYISVHEVNHFLKHRPTEWSVPVWLSFCAAGWYQNSILYRNRCKSLITAIETSARKTLPQNRKHLKSYLKKGCLPDLWLIVDSLSTDSLRYRGNELRLEYESLDTFRLQFMDLEIEKIRSRLDKTKYHLDNPEGVAAVIGTPRIELSVLCLLHLLLERHLKLVQLAEKYVLSELEFETMVVSVHNITFAFGLRYSNLAEGWRQQRLDSTLHVQTFASGIFETWHAHFSEVTFDEEHITSPHLYAGTMSPGDDSDRQDRQGSGEPDRINPKDFLTFDLPPQPTAEEVRQLHLAPKTRRHHHLHRADSKATERYGLSSARLKTKSIRNSRLHPPGMVKTPTSATRTSGPDWEEAARRLSSSQPRDFFYEFEFEGSQAANEGYNSADSSDIPDFQHTKSKIPKLEDRIRSVESELTVMKGMLTQLLALSKKD